MLQGNCYCYSACCQQVKLQIQFWIRSCGELTFGAQPPHMC